MQVLHQAHKVQGDQGLAKKLEFQVHNRLHKLLNLTGKGQDNHKVIQA